MVFLPTMTMQLPKYAPFRAMFPYAAAPKRQVFCHGLRLHEQLLPQCTQGGHGRALEILFICQIQAAVQYAFFIQAQALFIQLLN